MSRSFAECVSVFVCVCYSYAGVGVTSMYNIKPATGTIIVNQRWTLRRISISYTFIGLRRTHITSYVSTFKYRHPSCEVRLSSRDGVDFIEQWKFPVGYRSINLAEVEVHKVKSSSLSVPDNGVMIGDRNR